jgi:hypothetical protein
MHAEHTNFSFTSVLLARGVHAVMWRDVISHVKLHDTTGCLQLTLRVPRTIVFASKWLSCDSVGLRVCATYMHVAYIKNQPEARHAIIACT